MILLFSEFMAISNLPLLLILSSEVYPSAPYMEPGQENSLKDSIFWIILHMHNVSISCLKAQQTIYR